MNAKVLIKDSNSNSLAGILKTSSDKAIGESTRKSNMSDKAVQKKASKLNQGGTGKKQLASSLGVEAQKRKQARLKKATAKHIKQRNHDVRQEQQRRQQDNEGGPNG